MNVIHIFSMLIIPSFGMRALRVNTLPETSGISRESPKNDDRIVFPGETDTSTQIRLDTRPQNGQFKFPTSDSTQGGPSKVYPVPKCRNGEDLCEDVEEYPRYLNKSVEDKAVTKMMEKVMASVPVSTNASVPSQDLTSYLDADTFTPLRVRPVSQIEEIPLCAAKEEIIHPRVAKNIEEEYMFILNDGDKYIQGVRLEKCIKPDEPCHDSINEAAPSGFTTRCRQKFLYKKLLALSNDGSTMIQSFKIPSCCVCHLIPNFFSPQGRSQDTDIESSPVLNTGGGMDMKNQDAVDLTENDKWRSNLIYNIW